MTDSDSRLLSRETLLEYFLGAATPRDRWQVGMELEKMGRTSGGAPLPYESSRPSVRGVLEAIQAARGGEPILEGDHLIGLDAPWGSISLEPGGQVEWSSRPRTDLTALELDLDQHLAVLCEIESTHEMRWLDQAYDTRLSVDEMPWMPKARYEIMRPFLGQRGRLAHRMMTQTASIQVAFDYADPSDWLRKFRLAAFLAPVVTALFANSPGRDDDGTPYLSFRQAIWRETDPDRCGIPAVVFADGFDLEAWMDYVIDVPTIFQHRSRGLVATGGIPFRRLLERRGCESARSEDWETHISTIFTEVRSYSYIEIRCADLQTDESAFDVPTFWTGLLYDDAILSEGLELASVVSDQTSWREAMDSAAREGLEGTAGGRKLVDLAAGAVSLAIRGLEGDAACVSNRKQAADRLRTLAERRSLALRV